MRKIYKILRFLKVVCIRLFNAVSAPKSRQNFSLLYNSNSQAGQESFALLNSTQCSQKYYLEIGAGDPIKVSNTYLLESQFNWKGLSIDFNQKHYNNFKQKRENPLLVADSTRLNYKSLLLENNFPQVIAYLQIDVYYSKDAYKTLCAIPFPFYKFCSITYETDVYKGEDSRYTQLARSLLSYHGYILLCKNVMIDNLKFEDWWVHPKFSNLEVLSNFGSKNLNGLAHFSTKSQIAALRNYFRDNL
jgi:hypothetical protein